MEEEQLSAHDASREAVHTAKNAAQALEAARQAQLQEAIAETAIQTKEAILSSLKEVFGRPDGDNSKQMVVLYDRIPILCTTVNKMHLDIGDIRDANETIKSDLKWMKWIGSGFVAAAGMLALKSIGL